MVGNKNQYTYVLMLLVLLFISSCGYRESESTLNVIFISLDTTRQDFIDTGHGARALTPHIKDFAQKSLVFENAFTPSPQTLPAHLSALTSRLPHQLGVYDNEDIYDGRHPMLQQILQGHGYHTAAIISLGTLSKKTGFARGFDTFDDSLFTEKVFFVPAEKVASQAIKTLYQIEDSPFFLFLHFSDPHTPYAPPDLNIDFRIFVNGHEESLFNGYHGAILKKKFQLPAGEHSIVFKLNGPMTDFDKFIIRRFEIDGEHELALENLYFSKNHYNGSYIMDKDTASFHVKCNDKIAVSLFQIIPILKYRTAIENYRKEVEYMDRHIGSVLTHVMSSHLSKNTLVAMFADHGEGLGERENFFGHTRFLNPQFIRVPLLLYLPQVSSEKISSPISLTDISPMILEILNEKNNPVYYENNFMKSFHSSRPFHRTIYSFIYKSGVTDEKLSIIKWPLQGIFNLSDRILVSREFYRLDVSQSYHRSDALNEDVAKGIFPNLRPEIIMDYYQYRECFKTNNKNMKKRNQEETDKLSSLGYLE